MNLCSSDLADLDLSEEKIHLRLVQGRKKVTLVENLTGVDLPWFLKEIKKRLGCGGTQLDEQVLQFQGDQIQAIKRELIQRFRIERKRIIIHGC